MRLYQNIQRCIQYLPNSDNWFHNVCQIMWNIPLASKNNVWCFFRYILISPDICLGPHSVPFVFWFWRYIPRNGGKWYSSAHPLQLTCSMGPYLRCNFKFCCYHSLCDCWISWTYSHLQISHRVGPDCFHIIGIINWVHRFCSHLKYYVWILYSSMLY